MNDFLVIAILPGAVGPAHTLGRSRKESRRERAAEPGKGMRRNLGMVPERRLRRSGTTVI